MTERSAQLPSNQRLLSEFSRRVLVVIGLVALAVVIGTLFVLVSDLLFLFFAAILVAILLRGASDALSRWTGLGSSWSLTAVVLVVAALFAVGVYFLGATVVTQFNQFAADLPQSTEQARAYVRQYSWGDELLQRLPPPEQMLNGGGAGQVATRVGAFMSTTLGVLGNILVLTVLSLYLAGSPHSYVSGLLTLVPPARRRRAGQVLTAIGHDLRWWLLGRLVSVVSIGLLTGVGLWIIGVPQYLVLGLLTAVLSIVPYIGPLLAIIPGVLLALLQGPATAAWAAGVYVLAQAIESYLILPLSMRRAVDMSPVVTIASITIIGALFGVMGVIVASPLAVVLQVAVKMLYVEDVLGDDMAIQGAGGTGDE